VFGYLLLPMAVIALMPGERLRDYHISPRGFFSHPWIYAIMFALILPAVWVASARPPSATPIRSICLANRSLFDLWAWESMYAVQFLSLEFFFRGFLLQGLRRAIGANAIFVMVVPYCMIHYGKPMAETMGAVGAGLILGTLAMRTRSIWGGVVIHVGVAWTMDLLACGPVPATASLPVTWCWRRSGRSISAPGGAGDYGAHRLTWWWARPAPIARVGRPCRRCHPTPRCRWSRCSRSTTSRRWRSG
jgi:membrane protease YdiL (CAAX protease family)